MMPIRNAGGETTGRKKLVASSPPCAAPLGIPEAKPMKITPKIVQALT
jgi:hypothetical protein